MASIQKRSDTSYLLVVETGYDSKGRRKKRTKTLRIEDRALLKTTRKLKDYLNDQLHQFKIEVEAGEYIAPEKTLFKHFVEEWENKYAVKYLEEATLETYRLHLNNHIKPVFGHKRLDEIKPIHVVNFLEELKRKDGTDNPLSSSTKKVIYRTIRNVMERAKEWQLIKENPVASVKRPKDAKKDEVNVYSNEEIEQLFKHTLKLPTHWQVFVSLALAAGLRRGELLGLEWKHIDLDKGKLHVKQTLGRGKNGKGVVKEPKSKSSKRTISLPASIVAQLKLYQKEWQLERRKVEQGWQKDDKPEFIFCNIDGSPYYPTTPTTWWRRFTNDCGIRYIRLHDLRHTSATLLINQGVHAKIISERLGHADIRITMDTYGHALEIADQEAASKIDDIFTKKKAD